MVGSWAALSLAAPASVPLLPDLNARLHPSDSTPWTILLVLTLITLLPAILMAVTPMVRLLVVFHFLRQALGTQTAPSNPTLMGLALMMTWFLMTPVLNQVDQQAVEPYRGGQITGMEAIDRGAQPVKQFLLRYAREKDLALFTAAGQIPRPNKPEDLPMRVVMPAYILSELKTGFAIGAVLFLPFLLIDMVTAAITTYMGDQNVNYLETPSGQKIQLNVPGSQVFLGSGSNSVFGALNSLVADYSSGTVDTAQAVSDTQALSAALNNVVSQQRVTIDNSITQVTAASDAVTNVQTQLTTAQTNLMQADIPTVSTQLSLSETQQTALARIIREG